MRTVHLSIALASLLSFWSLSARADEAQFSDLKLYTSQKVNGELQAYTPKVGDKYQVTLEYTVTGTPSGAYLVRFDMANKHRTLKVSSPTGGTHKVSTQFFMPLDGSINIEARIPYREEAGAQEHAKEDDSTTGAPVDDSSVHVIRSSFTPTPPEQAIEYYDTKTVEGTQTATFSFQPGGMLQRWTTMAARPVTASWQKILQDDCRITLPIGQQTLEAQHAENPGRYPIFYFEGHRIPVSPVTLEQHFTAECSAVRVNADVLRKVTWHDIDEAAQKEKLILYAHPEKVIESDDHAIASFVKKTLGSDYRDKMTPYDAAKKIFQAVLAKTVYYYANDRPDTAVKVLKAGKGDCGGFSILLVACWRHMGIPARTAAGAWVGRDAGHCWSEMWFPPYGWLVSDGSAGNGQCEDGSYAYAFGNVPSLNARVAFMRGNTFNIGDVRTSWLQGPMYPNIVGNARIAKFDAHTVIKDITNTATRTTARELAPPTEFTKPQEGYSAPNVSE